MSAEFIAGFMRRHRLPADFASGVGEFYGRVFEWMAREHRDADVSIVGISGAQGSGKSTLADFLAESGAQSGLHVVALSLDDFYLTRRERRLLAATRHPLLETRGVPGTHDVGLLESTLQKLRDLADGEVAMLPVFDKSADDRRPPQGWRPVTGPVDIVLLEGWCVAALPEDEASLERPVNELERQQDVDGTWRRSVNDRLASDYAQVFARLERLVYLQVPDFSAVSRWRLEQEQKLSRSASGNTPGLMDEDRIGNFIQYFERITRNGLREIPSRADVLLLLDTQHRVAELQIREPSVPG